LSALLLLVLPLNAQHFSTKKAFVKMEVAEGDCQFETTNTSALVDLMAVDNRLTFMMPVKTFQLDERNKKRAFSKGCFPLDGFPLIAFKGELEGDDAWKKEKTGTYRVKLVGQLDIKGESVPISENVVLLLEDGKINLAFNTSLKIGKAKVNLDCDFHLKNQNQ